LLRLIYGSPPGDLVQDTVVVERPRLLATMPLIAASAPEWPGHAPIPYQADWLNRTDG
jgi:hypothetical protein